MDAMWEWVLGVLLNLKWLWQAVPQWAWWLLGVVLVFAGTWWVWVRRVLPSKRYRHHWRWRVELWLEIWFEDRVRSEHIHRQRRKKSKFWQLYACVASVPIVLWRKLVRHRWLSVLGAAAVSALWVVPWLTDVSLRELLQHALFQKNTNPKEASAAGMGAWSVVSAVLAAPIAFVLWWFRDINQLWLIENNRKDTNLKDFQKLSEWATGLHLVEDEVSTKTTAPAEGAASTETTVKRSQPLVTDGAPPSRREGSEALQVAAVHQLRGYLVGEFGQQFERPTLVLLLALWQRLTQNLSEPPTDFATKVDQGLYNAFAEWRIQTLRQLEKSPLAKAVQFTLLADKGLALRKHAPMLPSAWLFGIDSRLSSLEGLRLNHLSLSGLDLRLADLWTAKLQKTDLSWAQLQGANLMFAQLHGATLKSTRLQGVALSWAQLQRAYLNEVRLQGADLIYADLQETKLINPCVDHKTFFTGAKTDERTLVIVKKSRVSKILCKRTIHLGHEPHSL